MEITLETLSTKLMRSIGIGQYGEEFISISQTGKPQHGGTVVPVQMLDGSVQYWEHYGLVANTEEELIKLKISRGLPAHTTCRPCHPEWESPSDAYYRDPQFPDYLTIFNHGPAFYPYDEETPNTLTISEDEAVVILPPNLAPGNIHTNQYLVITGGDGFIKGSYLVKDVGLTNKIYKFCGWKITWARLDRKVGVAGSSTGRGYIRTRQLIPVTHPPEPKAPPKKSPLLHR